MHRADLTCSCHAGAISEPQVVAQFLTLLAGGLGVSYTLDRWAGHEFPTLLCLATFGSFISYIYSAPPLKLKQSGWIGNYALGSSYIALPWWAGQVGTHCCRPCLITEQINQQYTAPASFAVCCGLKPVACNASSQVIGAADLPMLLCYATCSIWACVLCDQHRHSILLRCDGQTVATQCSVMDTSTCFW